MVDGGGAAAEPSPVFVARLAVVPETGAQAASAVPPEWAATPERVARRKKPRLATALGIVLAVVLLLGAFSFALTYVVVRRGRVPAGVPDVQAAAPAPPVPVLPALQAPGAAPVPRAPSPPAMAGAVGTEPPAAPPLGVPADPTAPTALPPAPDSPAVDQAAIDDQVDVLLARAARARSTGRLAQAETDLLHALKLRPRSSRAVAGLVLTHLKRRDSSSAVRWARRLVELRPRRSTSHVLLGDALKLGGDQAGARAAWERALELSPRDKAARARLTRR
jgi:hypothetical protein